MSLSDGMAWEAEMSPNDMLRHVVGSLRMYPNGGGDTEVMAEVDRLIKEERAACAAIARAEWDSPEGIAQRIEARGK